MQNNRGYHKGRSLVILIVLIITSAMPPSSIWALPEVTFRRDVAAEVEIGGEPAVLRINFTCPRAGRIHVIATGILSNQVAIEGGGRDVVLRISRNSSQGRGHIYAINAAVGAQRGEDFAMQRVDACDAGQLNQYRLVATFLQEGPPSRAFLFDAVLTMTYYGADEP
jgi:hypothetical protein